MATLYITEYTEIGRDRQAASIQSGLEDGTRVNQTVAIGGSSVASNAFNANTRMVRLHTDAICSIDFGKAPTATTAKSRMAANTTEYFSIPLGASIKVAVITNT